MSKIERALRKAEEERRKKSSEESPPEQTPKEVLATAAGVTEATGARPERTHLSASFSKIAARLKVCCDNVGATDVVFTSAVSGEGKTTASINCAISLCQDFNLSVCLIDCDLRNPKISDYFTSNGSPGIVDALEGQVQADSIIQPTPVKGLSFVTSRRAGSLSLPLLNTERLGKLIRDLRTRFDLVVLDSPPILPLADTVVLSKNVSAVVLIVEAGKTRRKHIEQILEQIDREKVIGFIMNYKKHGVPETYNYSKYYDYGQIRE